jgi:3-(3-hydroxy-phenyl)propionate hydroxylase
MKYQPPRFKTSPPPSGIHYHPVVVVGGGLVGLTLALDLAQHGVKVTLLDDDDTVSVGSRAICFAKRSLEIYDRLGLGDRLLGKGATWNQGRVFFQDREIYQFNLLPESGHKFPAFVNLQQYHLEEWLVEACATAGVDLRWKHRVSGVANDSDHVELTVVTEAGEYRLTTGWLLACDGARSTIREAMALPFSGKVFHDHFLIADVEMQAAFPTERWFWFDPPFNPGQSVLLHRQADNIWRIDFQLGADADPEAERRPERVIPRIKAMLGPEAPFTLDWVSVYTFRCRRLEKFIHGRTVFVGDAAHQVSPFGARGGNGGIQDADNLAWKIAAILDGRASPALLASYDAERIAAADENILHSTRSTDFITPKSEAIRAYRDATLLLAEHFEFARKFVNSGRLSLPAILTHSPLNDPLSDTWPGAPPLGSPALDAPIMVDGKADWLLRHIGGAQCTLLSFAPFGADDLAALAKLRVAGLEVTPPARACAGAAYDHEGLVAARYGTPEGGAILFRPDQHILARWRRWDVDRLAHALDRVFAAMPLPAAEASLA